MIDASNGKRLLCSINPLARNSEAVVFEKWSTSFWLVDRKSAKGSGLKAEGPRLDLHHQLCGLQLGSWRRWPPNEARVSLSCLSTCCLLTPLALSIRYHSLVIIEGSGLLGQS